MPCSAGQLLNHHILYNQLPLRPSILRKVLTIRRSNNPRQEQQHTVISSNIRHPVVTIWLPVSGWHQLPQQPEPLPLFYTIFPYVTLKKKNATSTERFLFYPSTYPANKLKKSKKSKKFLKYAAGAGALGLGGYAIGRGLRRRGSSSSSSSSSDSD